VKRSKSKSKHTEVKTDHKRKRKVVKHLVKRINRVFRRKTIILTIVSLLSWVVITLVFTAIPGDLMYFPKVLAVNNRLSPMQKITVLWPGYKTAQESNNCSQAILLEQELFREITNQVALDKKDLFVHVAEWQSPTKLNCVTALPLKGLKILARLADKKADVNYSLVDASKFTKFKLQAENLIFSSQHTGFKSQRALNGFTELALEVRRSIPNITKYTNLELYDLELKIATMEHILSVGDVLAVNYQELFLASCLLSPEYEVCQNADKFNAKWNSVSSIGSPKQQLIAGRKLVDEVLVYQGLLTDN